ncbi:hypothetical protein RJT34_09846 [Clitoria ternatea]|uniref:Uncharacterized protein n=1 Tax=Clitoria ternatea TaxID=43366 RepID=A0AAN9PVC1_CLITE
MLKLQCMTISSQRMHARCRHSALDFLTTPSTGMLTLGVATPVLWIRRPFPSSSSSVVMDLSGSGSGSGTGNGSGTGSVGSFAVAVDHAPLSVP